MNHAQSSKQALRRLVKARIAAAGDSRDTEAPTVWNAIAQLPAWPQWRNVLLFESLRDELSTDIPLAQWPDCGKTLFLPRMVGDDLEIVPVAGRQLQRDPRYGINEPMGDATAVTPDVAIIPGVAFDRVGHRLGRGKGFYDRLLARLEHTYKIGVAMQCQLVDNVPCELHDVTMDAVITAAGVHIINPSTASLS